MTERSEIIETLTQTIYRNWSVSLKDATADVEALYTLAADHSISELYAEFQNRLYHLDDLYSRTVAWEGMIALRLMQVTDDPIPFLTEKKDAFLSAPEKYASDRILHAANLPEDLQFALFADSEMNDTLALSDAVFTAMHKSFPNLETVPYYRLLSLINEKRFEEALDVIPLLTRFSDESDVYEKFSQVYFETGQIEPLRLICHRALHDYLSRRSIDNWETATDQLHQLYYIKGFSLPDRDLFEMAEKLISAYPHMKWNEQRASLIYSLTRIMIKNAKVMRDDEVCRIVSRFVNWVDSLALEGCLINEYPYSSMIADIVVEIAKQLPDVRFRKPFRDLLDHFTEKRILPKEMYPITVPSGYRSLESYAVYEDLRLSWEMRELSSLIYDLEDKFDMDCAFEAVRILKENPYDERIIHKDYPYMDKLLSQAKKRVRAKNKAHRNQAFKNPSLTPQAAADFYSALGNMDSNGNTVMPWGTANLFATPSVDSSGKMPDPARKTEPIKAKKVGRNDPCPCGSGKKYKHCCGR